MKLQDITEDFRQAAEERSPSNFRIGKQVRGNQLRRGMKLSASYKSTNEGTDYIEVLGFSDTRQKYGESGVKFNSVKDIFRSLRGVASLKGLEEHDNQNEYGHSHYLIVRDLQEGDSGPWYYLYNGRWSRGSGAEALSFHELNFTPIKEAKYDSTRAIDTSNPSIMVYTSEEEGGFLGVEFNDVDFNNFNDWEQVSLEQGIKQILRALETAKHEFEQYEHEEEDPDSPYVGRTDAEITDDDIKKFIDNARQSKNRKFFYRDSPYSSGGILIATE